VLLRQAGVVDGVGCNFSLRGVTRCDAGWQAGVVIVHTIGLVIVRRLLGLIGPLTFHKSDGTGG
jgi:hypothetical protein